MSAIRKEIRKNILKLLKGRTDARDRVVENSGHPMLAENLPRINLYYRGEKDIVEYDQAPRRMQRQLALSVEIVAEGKDETTVCDCLDDLCEQVERWLSVDDTIGGCASDIILASVGDYEIESGTKLVGKIDLVFLIRYETFNPRDRTGQGKFETFDEANAEWNLNQEQAAADRASDTITVP